MTLPPVARGPGLAGRQLGPLVPVRYSWESWGGLWKGHLKIWAAGQSVPCGLVSKAETVLSSLGLTPREEAMLPCEHLWVLSKPRIPHWTDKDMGLGGTGHLQ